MEKVKIEVTENRLRKFEQAAKNRQSGLVLVLEDIHFPSNAQAMFRSAEAFGIQDIYLIFEREQVFDAQKADKEVSSSGYKWLNFKYFDSSAKCFNELKSEGYKIVVTALSEQASNLYETDLTDKKIALVMGSEASGVSKIALEQANQILTLPMFGLVQSLNVSASCAVFLYEITRQRYPKIERYRLSEKEQENLIEEFTRRK